MERKLQVTLERPLLDNQTSVLATSYQVSRLPDFNKTEYIIVNDIEDTKNLFYKEFPINIDKYETLYVRTKFHYSDIKYQDDWSPIVPLKGEQVGIKLSGTIVSTPKVNTSISYDNINTGEIIVTTSDMRLYSGAGIHKSSSWILADIDGNEIYKRLKDEDNLTSFNIDARLIKPAKAYIMKVRHHTDTNADSNYGKSIIITSTDETSLFDIKMYYDLMPNRWMYFELYPYTNKFKSCDIIIVDEFDNIITENLLQATRTPKLYTDNLKPYYRYTIKARIKLTNGEYSSYKTVYSGIIKDNNLIDYKYNLKYLDKFTYTQPFMFNGLSVQTSRELYTGDILLTKNNDSGIYRYALTDNKLMELEKIIDISNNQLDLPYTNIIPLYSGRVVINYASDKDNEHYRKSIFKLYDYNPVTRSLVELRTLTKNNERYSTSVSNSACAMYDGDIYYIPNMESDDNKDNYINLKLKIIDTETFTSNISIELPFNAITNVSMCAIDHENILILGGSTKSIFLDNKISSYKRDNDDVYIFNTKTRLFNKVASLENIDKDYYNFQMSQRRDGKIVLFNAVETGPKVGDQRTIVIDPKTFIININDNDYGDNVKYNSLLSLNNGDMMRISNLEVDPQKIFTYVSDTYSINQLVDNVTIRHIEDLVVPAGKVVTIESPYRYKSITIQGTSMEDTGLLQWLDGNIIREFRYRDLLIARNTEDNRNLYYPIKDYDSITVLEDIEYSVINYIHIPANEEFTITAPFKVDYILLEQDAVLNINFPDE